MIIDLTSSLALEAVETSLEHPVDIVAEVKEGSYGGWDSEAYAEWMEYRDKRLSLLSLESPRDEAIAVVEMALSDPYMCDILVRASRDRIRSRIAVIVNRLRQKLTNRECMRGELDVSGASFALDCHAAAVRIVDLDRKNHEQT
ncbi:MAG: hypothetical protein ACXAC5_00505 [Promethearchaeota archaeon]|jgi:hypothetical protein